MARARFIRPEFFTDEKMGELPFGARLLFAGIWCHADLRGVFEHSARQLRVQVFPFDEGVTSGQVGEWLTALIENDMVACFEAGGKVWGHVVNWSRHQTAAVREVEIGSSRPRPPGFIDPPKWAEIVQKALIAGRIGVGSRTVLEQFQNTTPTPSPSPPPTPTTAPSPSPGKDITATAAAAGPCGPLAMKGEKAVNVRALETAIAAGDPVGIAAAFYANTAKDRRGEWIRDTDGLQAGVIAGIFALWRNRGMTIREPSGFRGAHAEFREWPAATRLQGAVSALKKLGVFEHALGGSA